MTAHYTLSITCDHGGHYLCTTPEYFAGADETAKEARKFLRTIGWRYVPGHPTTGPGRDLCPEHAGEAS